MNSERKAFEEWATKEDNYCLARNFHVDGSYDEWDTQSAWDAWQASANRQGYKLVPVEPTEKMSLKGYHAINRSIRMDGIDLIYKAMIGAVDEK